jgi:alkanesulfonate monooxygenase SsuD/methylene tetrahydromethanopterin reductase-like flavin-dependent oxidoreductase (luciferase family)
MRRTARLGDAWYPIGTNPRNRLDTLARLNEQWNKLRGQVQAAGRNVDDVKLAYRFSQFGKEIPERADNGERRLGSGENAAIVADLRALGELGVIAVDFNFGGNTADAVIANIPRFREDVLAKV